MISRRTVLKWLGLASVAAVVPAAASVPGDGVALTSMAHPYPVRQRVWKTVLEPDLSSVVAKVHDRMISEQKQEYHRWLDLWADAQDSAKWNEQGVSLEDVKGLIAADQQAVEERANPWRELDEFCEATGTERPIFYSEVTLPGEWMPSDYASFGDQDQADERHADMAPQREAARSRGEGFCDYLNVV